MFLGLVHGSAFIKRNAACRVIVLMELTEPLGRTGSNSLGSREHNDNGERGRNWIHALL